MYYCHMESPVGPLLLAGEKDALQSISFPRGSRARSPEPGWRRDRGPFVAALEQLEAYFDGSLTDFDLALAPRGTPFQLSVWQQLRQIPYGTTISYGELARRIGRPSASRAVGAANGANPLSIVVPCHRVIGSSGKLTGFGGGLPTKAALLAHERQVAGTAGQQTAFPFLDQAV